MAVIGSVRQLEAMQEAERAAAPYGGRARAPGVVVIIAPRREVPANHSDEVIEITPIPARD
jgi:hypothetical protein